MNCSICSSKAHFQCGNLCQTLYCNQACQIKDWNKNHAVECINLKVKRGRGSNFSDKDYYDYGGEGPFEEALPSTREQEERFEEEKAEYERRYLEQEKRTKVEMEREEKEKDFTRTQMDYFIYEPLSIKMRLYEFYNLLREQVNDEEDDPVKFLDNLYESKMKLLIDTKEMDRNQLEKFIWNFTKFQIESFKLFFQDMLKLLKLYRPLSFTQFFIIINDKITDELLQNELFEVNQIQTVGDLINIGQRWFNYEKIYNKYMLKWAVYKVNIFKQIYNAKSSKALAKLVDEQRYNNNIDLANYNQIVKEWESYEKLIN